MKVTFATSVKDYLNIVEELLLKKEACNNLMLGLLDRLLTHKAECYLGYVENEGNIVYAFMQTPPSNWILADVENVDQDAIEAVAKFIYQKKLEVPGVLGSVPKTEKFVKHWQKLTNKKAVIHMNQLIYQLDEVQSELRNGGKLIHAAEKHFPLIADWLYQFGQEANELITQTRAEQMATRFINNRSIYLWQTDGQLVSMANRSRKTKNGATINAVFTPDKFKRKGHATGTVAHLSQKILDEGFQFCSLYTDSANPTSNNIYKKIGYYEVGSSIVYKF